MGIEDFIRLGDAPPSLKFLLIGGYAVGAHGFTRTTLDVDFLINRGDRDLWLAKIEGEGLKKVAETTTFIQFSQEVGDGLDLMIVSGETFEKLWAESKETDVLSTRCRLPSLDHLIALKLHALKQKLPHRTSKDAQDVEMLARNNHLDLTQPHYQELFLKHGSPEIYETILRILKY